MKTFIVSEYEVNLKNYEDIMNINEVAFHGCTGCWSCWWRTPGKCAFKDLEQYYTNYINADTVVYFLDTNLGFVSSKIKKLFDRMIPLFLPYSNFHTGESMHHPRYEKYPAIKIYYKDTDLLDNEKTVLEEYLHRTFYQFHSKDISVLPLSEFKEELL